MSGEEVLTQLESWFFCNLFSSSNYMLAWCFEQKLIHAMLRNTNQTFNRKFNAAYAASKISKHNSQIGTNSLWLKLTRVRRLQTKLLVFFQTVQLKKISVQANMNNTENHFTHTSQKSTNSPENTNLITLKDSISNYQNLHHPSTRHAKSSARKEGLSHASKYNTVNY